jgi:ribonuclease G
MMDILIEELNGSLWVAAVDKGRLIGLEVDPFAERVRYGSIYRAQVKRIDLSMDAAFLELDDGNVGILHNRDVRIRKNKKIIKGGDVAIGKLLTAGQMVLVQARSGYLPADPDEDIPPLPKMPVMTMDIALHGRYLIGTPLTPKSRISQRIRDGGLRRQMQKMLTDLNDVDSVILRKAAAHTQTDWLTREGRILKTVWENVERVEQGTKPELLMLGADAVQRTLADQAAERIDHIEVVTLDQYKATEQWCEIFAPDLVTKLRAVEMDDNDNELGLFIEHNIMDQIDALPQPYAMLPGGGNIIVQPTAAMVVIDINSGADRRGALAVNLEAAQNIARQIRLRNLGGIIIIDFMKMTSVVQKNKVIDLLEQQFDDDPCTVQIHGFTKLGLLELTRNRRTPTLTERIAALGDV